MFIDRTMQNLTPAQVKVWMVLYRDTKADSGIARVGQAAIAKRAGTSRRTVVTAIQSLIKTRLVEIVRQGGWSEGVSSYRVHPEPYG